MPLRKPFIKSSIYAILRLKKFLELENFAPEAAYRGESKEGDGEDREAGGHDLSHPRPRHRVSVPDGRHSDLHACSFFLVVTSRIFMFQNSKIYTEKIITMDTH